MFLFKTELWIDISSIYNEERLTNLVISCIVAAFYKALLKGIYKGGGDEEEDMNSY